MGIPEVAHVCRGRVAQDDVAAAVAMLPEPTPHAGRTYDLTGPEELALTDVAAVLTTVAGRAVPCVRATVEEAFASRASYGAPHRQVDAPPCPTWPGTARTPERVLRARADAGGLWSRGRQVRWCG